MTMRLRTLLGDHAGTAALKSGAVKSDIVNFDFVDCSPTNKGFKPMVREQAFDVSEMAIVTYLMARSLGKPMVLLPDVVLARFQHSYALYNAKYGALKPTDLNGKRVGIRSFTTTTGAWLRGILANDYGVDLDSTLRRRMSPNTGIRRSGRRWAKTSSRCWLMGSLMRCWARRSSMPT